MQIRTIRLAVLLVTVASPVLAHSGHDSSGFAHPFTGLDHLLAMVGVGVWASLLAVKRPAAAYLVPASFIAMMLVGAAAGFAGIKLPLAEAAIVASVLILGALIMAAVRIPSVGAMVVVGFFALFHGYAHAIEAPTSGTALYISGFVAATARLGCKTLAW